MRAGGGNGDERGRKERWPEEVVREVVEQNYSRNWHLLKKPHSSEKIARGLLCSLLGFIRQGPLSKLDVL